MKIDLEEFMARHDLKSNEVARQLFPDNKHAMNALYRVLRGEGTLNVEQVGKLATMAGVGIAQVFKSGSWTSEMYSEKILFFRGDYIDELNQREWKVYLFHKGSLFHSEVLVNPTIDLTAFLDMISLKMAENEFKNVETN